MKKTLLDTRIPDFPVNPGDGFEIKEDLPNGGYVIWKYSEQFNQWTYQTFGGEMEGYIFTDQVLIRDEDQAGLNADPSTLRNQKDINHFLDTKVAEEVDGLASEEYVNEAISRIPPPPSLDGHVTKQEFTQSQAEQDLEIAKIDDKVDQLTGKAGQGKWAYDSAQTNPRQGDFVMLGSGSIPTNQWANVVVIKFNAEDAAGHEFDFHRAVEGDVIKLGYEFGPEVSYAEFQVTPGGNGNFGVTRLLGHEGTARDDWRYDVEHFSSFDPAGVATQTYVDEGDDAVKEYVDQRIDSIPEIPINDYLKKSGGTMTGALRMKRTDDSTYWNYIYSDKPKAWDQENKNHGLILNIGSSNTYKQQFKIQGRSDRDLFEIHDDGSALAVMNGRMNFTEGLKVGGKPVATEEYIDGKVLHATIPGMRWKYASHSKAEDLVAGEFFVSSSDNLYLHPKSFDGNDLSVSSTVNYETINILISVYGNSGNSLFSMCGNEVKFNNNDNNYIRVQKRNKYYKGSFAAGTVYHISIPGFSS